MRSTKVKDIINITENLFILRLDKEYLRDLDFIPGQHFSISTDGIFINREYSSFSPNKSDNLDFLIRKIKGGVLTTQLAKVKINDNVFVHGPFGNFTLKDDFKNRKKYFISSGTGVAPFLCFIKSFKDLNYELIHGTRYIDELSNTYIDDNLNATFCISKDENHTHFKGRVTDYILSNRDLFKEDQFEFYLCGNSSMISEVYRILFDEFKLRKSNIYSEAFF